MSNEIQNTRNKQFTTIVLPDNRKVQLKNCDENLESLKYMDRLEELYHKIPEMRHYKIVKTEGSVFSPKSSADHLLEDFESYWFGQKNTNGKWTQKVQTCLDYIATYLLKAPDSGIKPCLRD